MKKIPRQFDFGSKWNSEIRALRECSNIEFQFDELKSKYRDIIECKRDEAVENGFRSQAEAEFETDLSRAEKRFRDLPWLRKTFTGICVSELSLAIAEELFPDKTWEILERDEFAVVTDLERTMVFDLLNFDTLSAGASLVLADDIIYKPSAKVFEEVLKYQNARKDVLENSLQQVQEVLAQADSNGEVMGKILPFRPRERRPN